MSFRTQLASFALIAGLFAFGSPITFRAESVSAESKYKVLADGQSGLNLQ